MLHGKPGCNLHAGGLIIRLAKYAVYDGLGKYQFDVPLSNV